MCVCMCVRSAGLRKAKKIAKVVLRILGRAEGKFCVEKYDRKRITACVCVRMCVMRMRARLRKIE